MSKQGQRAEDSGRATKGEKATTSENRAQKEGQNRSTQSQEEKGTTAGRNESQAGKAAQERNKSASENERATGRNTAQEREHMGGKMPLSTTAAAPLPSSKTAPVAEQI